MADRPGAASSSSTWPTDETAWPEQHQGMHATLEEFREVFAPSLGGLQTALFRVQLCAKQRAKQCALRQMAILAAQRTQHQQ